MSIPDYDPSFDPTVRVRQGGPIHTVVDWTQDGGSAKRVKAEADALDDAWKRERKKKRAAAKQQSNRDCKYTKVESKDAEIETNAAVGVKRLDKKLKKESITILF